MTYLQRTLAELELAIASYNASLGKPHRIRLPDKGVKTWNKDHQTRLVESSSGVEHGKGTWNDS